MTELSPQIKVMWATLKKVAEDTLEHKRRLGEYAVIWQDGKLVAIGDDAPSYLEKIETKPK